jgi:Cu+-exporting ATPase
METIRSYNAVNSCYHCGEDCIETRITFEEHSFCCVGCKTVYELLHQHELCEYYALADHPGQTLKQQKVDLRFAYLDHEEIKQKLLLFQDTTQEKVNLHIPSIHCSSCIWLLENLQRLHPGIQHSTVVFLKKDVSVTYDPNKITLREVAELLFRFGYAPDIKLNQPDDVKEIKTSLGLKIGIAGFCFGNSMLFSLPEYFSGGVLLGWKNVHLFAYLNLLLSLPVFFYCASEYFASAIKGIKAKLISINVPISLGILMLFLRSSIDVISHNGSGYFDSLTGLVFFLLIGKWFQNKTYQSLSFEKDYRSYFPIAVIRLTAGKEEIIPLDRVREGDLLRIRNQEIIPCDSRLFSAHANIDYSFVTGEAFPVQKKQNEVLFAGGKAVNNGFTITATKAVSKSYLIELWKQDAFRSTKKQHAATLIDRVSHHFTTVILGIALLSGCYWWLVDPSNVWEVVSAVLIVACPCGLALSLPFTFGNTVRIFGKMGLFLKDAKALEQLARIDTMAFDKTGTLTEHKNQRITYTGLVLSKKEKVQVASICRNSLHPLSQALYEHLASLKTSSTHHFIEKEGKGITAQVGPDHYRIGSIAWLDVKNGTTSTAVGIEKNERYLGLFTFSNVYRAQLQQTINSLAPKYNLAVVSGDNESEQTTLSKYFPRNTIFKFNQSPFDKLNFIRSLQQQGQHCLMVGDGLNDAGALKQSDFGIAIAQNVHHFSPSCDAILQSDRFYLLPFFVRFSTLSMQLVKVSIALSFLYNIVGITLAVQGALSPLAAAILMPMSSITVVGFATTSTNILSRYFLQKMSKVSFQNDHHQHNFYKDVIHLL